MAISTDIPDGFKRCRGHDRTEHIASKSQFAAARGTVDGLQKLCTDCHATSMRAYRERLKARYSETAALHQTSSTKRCARCQQVGREPARPLTDFYVARDQPDGKRSHCKDCVRELRWLSYGIVGMTVERFDLMLAEQGGRCAIPSCQSNGDYRVLDVDHDHVTGEVRGLVCRACNTVLGKCRESVQILGEMIDYLNRTAVIAS
jgi:Autographiviridae endonuclease VII